MTEFLLIETAALVGDGAATTARPRVMGLAYGGGKISLPGWKHPIVVDLAGLTLPESVPLLANHENHSRRPSLAKRHQWKSSVLLGVKSARK